ncbi:MAG: hypothetical protein H6865_02540 [Rhodospirillales bacterium]|nr:hypothetical protein [Alphaproteobacteria bacterium]MCB9986494.1 hypothetical protein [Rhodospirillales bacterium]USO06961.1 MAG: hypothetical protein H6866_05845 [Rhodospirillales bacterium]
MSKDRNSGPDRENRILAAIFRRKVRRAQQRAGDAVQEGATLFEAATCNRDHPQLPKSEPHHIKGLFALAAVTGLAGMALAYATVGPVTIMGDLLLYGAKATMMRAARVRWPFDPKNPARFTDNPLRAAADFLESTSQNMPHPLLPSTGAVGYAKLLGAVSAIAIGFVIDYGTTGPLSVVALGLRAGGFYFGYRWFRSNMPHKQPGLTAS